GYGLLIYIAVFIHVLAAKTGLMGFYIVNAVAILSVVPRKWRVASILLFISIPLMGWFLLPSFQNRVKFVIWDFQNYSRGSYVEGLSDGPRIISYQAGMEVFSKHPVTGVGSGDVLGETWKWYDDHASFLKNYERLLPSNEVLLYACAGGILAALICLVALFYPFFMRTLKGNMIWICFHIVSVIGFMYEIGLEVQHGVFLYSFFSCWFYAKLSPSAAVEAT
ncbi:MAG TPA: O-antigen ligase family protein, partial [Chitinophagaceae bacterium]|nr:O-antigen ligase family protein [Chitinophagaceae bacterium]